MLRSILPVVIATIIAKTAFSEIIQYVDHLIMPDRPEYLVMPKFDKKEVPHWYPGRGRSFIDFSNVRIHSSCDPEEVAKRPVPPGTESECKDVTFEVLMFEDEGSRPWMNFWEEGDYCCTDEVVAAGGCGPGNLNKLIVPANLPGAFLRSTIVKSGESASLTEDGLSRNDIKKSGNYVVVMAMCDPESFPVVVEGAIESVDPYGYVPADQFGSMPFNLALSLMYLIIALSWGALCFIYSDQLMPLQYWITGVMIIAMIESTLQYFHFIDWNDHGVPTLAVTFIALLFGSLKRALSRILVMLVSLGYGVVRPSLGEEMHRVLYLGGSYFVLTFVYSLMMNLSPTTRLVSKSDYDVVSLLIFLLAIIDTTFYVWVFTSINNLMTSLASRKQGVKYLLYRNFRTVLLVMLFFTCAWVLYSSALFLNDAGGANSNWRMKWTIDALWELIYFVIFVAIAVLWAPSNNAQRYAYSIELSQLDNDEEFQAADTPSAAEGDDDDLDSEYGGRLNDEKDPFQGTGALDPSMAASKKA